MGISDHNSLPMLIFSVVYLGFIMIMYSMISPINDINTTSNLGVNSISLGNFYTNFSELGLWNILVFSPIIFGLLYIVLALATPSVI